MPTFEEKIIDQSYETVSCYACGDGPSDVNQEWLYLKILMFNSVGRLLTKSHARSTYSKVARLIRMRLTGNPKALYGDCPEGLRQLTDLEHDLLKAKQIKQFGIEE